MKRAITLLILVIVSQAAYSIPLKINVPEVINGNKAYLQFEQTTNESPQIFLMDWENQGSVSCKARMRVDISNGTTLLYTAWSREVPLEPGDHSELEAYYYPEAPGEYQANISMYFCNTIRNVGNVSFISMPPQESGSVNNMAGSSLEIKEMNTENYVELTIRSKENINSPVIISPRSYPLGWIFEGAKLEGIRENEEATARLDYVPTIWKPVTIELDISTLDGRYHQTEEIVLTQEQKGYQIEQAVIPFLILVIMILMVLLIRKGRKKSILELRYRNAVICSSRRSERPRPRGRD
jgi:hypothetical protein